MKIFNLIPTLLTTVIVLTSSFTPTQAASLNLVPNSSAEIPSGSPNAPIDWSTGNWGTNQTTFTYDNTKAQNGRKSLKVEMKTYRDGDAKWFFKPIKVTPQTRYSYSNYYQSAVSTQTVARFTNSDSTYTYQVLGQNPKSTVWKKTYYYITAPTNSTELTVYHLINKVGVLSTDNFTLSQISTPPPVIDPQNYSFEQASPLNINTPSSWQTGSWGTNNAQFSYPTTGHTGSKSAKIQITNYTDGDAKWYHDPIPVEAGKYYQYTDYYKSNIESQIIAALNNSDGSTNYVTLKKAPASANWAKFTDGVNMSANTQTVTFFHLIGAIGYLTIDDISLNKATPPKTAFDRALVSLNFDDGWSSIYNNGLPLLQKYNIPSTQYIISNNIGLPNYMTHEQIAELQAAGHEIGSHSLDHSDLTTLTNANLTNQLSSSKNYLTSLFGDIINFSLPYGAYNTSVTSEIKRYYRSSRTSDVGFNTLNNFDPYQIRIQYLTNQTTSEQVNAWVNQAITDKSWLVILYHQIDNSSSEFSTTPANLENNLSYIKNSGITAVTVNQALNELIPQVQ